MFVYWPQMLSVNVLEQFYLIASYSHDHETPYAYCTVLLILIHPIPPFVDLTEGSV